MRINDFDFSSFQSPIASSFGELEILPTVLMLSVHLKNIVILIFSNLVNGKQAAMDAGQCWQLYIEHTVLFYL